MMRAEYSMDEFESTQKSENFTNISETSVQEYSIDSGFKIKLF